MMNNMSDYFVAEKQESVIFVVVGLLAIGFSLWLWMNGHRLKYMAYPLVVIASDADCGGWHRLSPNRLASVHLRAHSYR